MDAHAKRRWRRRGLGLKGTRIHLVMIICCTGASAGPCTDSDLAINRKECPFRVLMCLYLTKLRTRHLHGTCASRIRRVRRPPCACLELRWTGGILDGKEDPDREGEEEEEEEDAQAGDGA